MEAKQNENIKKSKIIVSLLKYTGKGLLAILLILSIIFQLPWKVITLLAIFLAAGTILPGRFRKWFWLTAGSAALILTIWILLPEDNMGWRPYTFDKEIASYKAKYEIPDQENALAIYSLLISKKENLFFDFPDLSQDDYTINHFWTTKEYPELADWLSNREDIIKVLFEGAKKDKCQFPIDFQIEWPQITQDLLHVFRYSIEIAIRSANNDIAENHFEQAIEKYLCISKIARQISAQQNIFDYLYGTSLEYRALKQINMFVIEKEPAKEQLQLLLQTIDNVQNNWETDFKKMLEFDSLLLKSNFARTYEVNGKGRTRISRNPEVPIIEIYGHSIITGRFIPDIHPHKFNSVIAWFYLPFTPKKAADIFESNFSQCYQMAKPDFDWDFEKPYMDLHFVFNYSKLIKDFVTYRKNEYYPFIHERYLRSLTFCRGTHVSIALRQYKNENGKWPDRLEEIKSLAPAEAFIDPATGKQLPYENEGEQFSLSGELIKIWPFE